jgi:tetratricopeptide (TPR) repeat protein
MKNYDEAVKIYDRAIETYPQNDLRLAKVWYNKGLALAKFCMDSQSLDLCSQSLESFNKSIEINPQDEKAWYGKHTVLLRLGRLSEASDALIRGHKIDRINFEQRIDKIKNIINSWRPLPSKPIEFVDSKSFVKEHDAFLVRIGEKIKIRTISEGDIDITYDDLRGDSGRIGIGFEFLNLLKNRLNAFKTELDEAAKQQTPKPS